MLAALGVRLHGINQSLVTFHPTRHYRSAVIARACYYDATPSVAAWARSLADSARSMQPVGEPPFMEWMACQSYRALGHEDIRIPRMLVMICWILGAIPLYGLAVRLGSAPAAIVAVALYLFMPYSIVATRSFQPDAPMTLCTLIAALAVARYFESPVGVAVRRAALLVGAGHGRQADERVPDVAGADRHGAGAPALVEAGRQPAGSRCWCCSGSCRRRSITATARCSARSPAIRCACVSCRRCWPRGFFWQGWLTQIRRVFGVPLFVLSLLARSSRRAAPPGALMAALWIGYAAFAVAFTYHMPTHDYYHLPYVAVVALGAAATLERLQAWMAGRVTPGAMLGGRLHAAVASPAGGRYRHGRV